MYKVYARSSKVTYILQPDGNLCPIGMSRSGALNWASRTRYERVMRNSYAGREWSDEKHHNLELAFVVFDPNEEWVEVVESEHDCPFIPIYTNEKVNTVWIRCANGKMAPYPRSMITIHKNIIFEEAFNSSYATEKVKGPLIATNLIINRKHPLIKVLED